MAASLELKTPQESYSKIDIRPATFLGDFSVDGTGRLCHDNKKYMKFLRKDFRTIQTQFDLNKDIERRKGKNMQKFLQERNNIALILEWIIINKKSLLNSSGLFSDFVLRRGNICTIMKTPYDSSNDWSMRVVRYRGTIYIAGDYQEEEMMRRSFESAMATKFSAYGYKFEQCMKGETGPIDETEEYYAVVDTYVSNNRLMIYGEIDGIDRDKYAMNRTPNMNACIELKINSLLNSDWNISKFKRYNKQLDWWAQSAVFGISEIVCGFRDAEGVIRSIDVIKLNDVPSYKGIKGGFDTNVMLKFAERFFDWLKAVIPENSQTVYRIKYDTLFRKVTCEKTSDNSFITKSYMEKMSL